MVVSRWPAWLSLLLVTLLPLAACLADEGGPEGDAAAAKAAAERDARAIGRLIQRGVRVLAQEAAPADRPQIDEQRPQIDEQRRQMIDQQAKQMEGAFLPLLNGELEMIRRTCGGLAPEARQRILAAGREATAATARAYTERQFTGRLGQDEFDPRQEIRGRLEQALAPVADPAELAAYRQEIERREARRAEAARVAIVACVDRQLQLSAEQRTRIEEDLAKNWQAAWVRDLGSRGDMRINGLPPAPDHAAKAIEPHLDRDQAVAWKKWRQQASARNFGRHFSWQFGQGLQQPDLWWGR